ATYSELARGPGGAAASLPATAARSRDPSGSSTPGHPDGWTPAPGPGRGRRDCPGCGRSVLRSELALQLVSGWWHRSCWLSRSWEREEALRSAREAVGRRLAVADYLLAQNELGGMPALVSGPILEPSLVGQDAADNGRSRYRGLGYRVHEPAGRPLW